MQSISERFAQALQDKFNDESNKHPLSYGSRWEYRVVVEAGRKFDRIVISSDIVSPERPFSPHQRSVHAFIERATGRLIKSAGWSAPAKWGGDLASRYTLTTQFDEALAKADAHGSYLYQ